MRIVARDARSGAAVDTRIDIWNEQGRSKRRTTNSVIRAKPGRYDALLFSPRHRLATVQGVVVKEGEVSVKHVQMHAAPVARGRFVGQEGGAKPRAFLVYEAAPHLAGVMVPISEENGSFSTHYDPAWRPFLGFYAGDDKPVVLRSLDEVPAEGLDDISPPRGVDVTLKVAPDLWAWLQAAQEKSLYAKYAKTVNLTLFFSRPAMAAASTGDVEAGGIWRGTVLPGLYRCVITVRAGLAAAPLSIKIPEGRESVELEVSIPREDRKLQDRKFRELFMELIYGKNYNPVKQHNEHLNP
jgi:hypothetical protein